MHDPVSPVAFEFPNETVRDLPEPLRTRLEGKEQDVEQMRADSQRLTERSQQLRDAHLESVKARAHRESQRAEEAKARQLRNEADHSRKVLQKMEATQAKADALKQQLADKREEDKARRLAMAENAANSRVQSDVNELTKGLQNAAREEKAIAKRDDIVEEVVRRNHMVVEHARETAVHVKQMSARSAAAAEAREQTTREMAEAGGTSLPADGSGVESIVRLPPPQVGDASSLDSPHPVITGASSRGAPGGVPALDTPSEGKKSPTPRPADMAKRAASPRKLSINPAPPPLGLASVGLSGANCFSDLSMKPKHAKDRSKNVVKDVMPKQMPHQTLTPRATESPRRPEMPTIMETEFESTDFANEFWPTRNFERAFERHYYRVEMPNGRGFVWVYEIRWADGTTRMHYGRPHKGYHLEGAI